MHARHGRCRAGVHGAPAAAPPRHVQSPPQHRSRDQVDTEHVSVSRRLKLMLEMEGAWAPTSIRARARSFSSRDTREGLTTCLGHRVPPRHHLHWAPGRGRTGSP